MSSPSFFTDDSPLMKEFKLCANTTGTYTEYTEEFAFDVAFDVYMALHKGLFDRFLTMWDEIEDSKFDAAFGFSCMPYFTMDREEATGCTNEGCKRLKCCRGPDIIDATREELFAKVEKQMERRVQDYHTLLQKKGECSGSSSSAAE